MLVESDGKKDTKIRTIEGIPVYLSGASENKIIDFCKNSLKLKNPCIKINEIKINSLLKINGYPMHISGKSNNRLAMKNAVQLCVDGNINGKSSIVNMKYMKLIEKLCTKVKEENIKEIEDNEMINNYKITKSENIEIYNILMNKQTNTIYKNRPASQADVLKNGVSKFADLTLLEQCKVIMEILHLFECNFVSCDLREIGGSGQAGVFMISKDITKNKSAFLLTQSATGIFVNEVNLLKV